jgi:hypothetical protein
VTAGLQRWTPLPQLLPGENRSFGSGLFVDLAPSTCWFSNIRTCVQPASWDRIRVMVYGRAAERCEACGRPADRAAGLQLEAHERWAYDPARRVQSLRRLVCLCSACHGVTHLGLANVQGQGEQAFRHLLQVAGMRSAWIRGHVFALDRHGEEELAPLRPAWCCRRDDFCVAGRSHSHRQYPGRRS